MKSPKKVRERKAIRLNEDGTMPEKTVELLITQTLWIPVPKIIRTKKTAK